jgi:hypothetical protein
MGQMTMGILLGVRAPEGVEMHSDEHEHALLDVWYEACRGDIRAHDARVNAWVMAKPGRMPYQRTDGCERYIPDSDYDTGLVGFWVAAGASGKNGLPALGAWQRPGYIAVPMSAAGAREAFPKAYRNARARWRRFREWCSAHRDLPGAEYLATTSPTLWLAPTEVA